MKSLFIMGIRGVPARHGGFETFAESLCTYLNNRGWAVVVYCQEDGSGHISESDWQGIRRVHIPVKGAGPLSTIMFDLKSVLHSLKQDGVFLTLGYNTAVFNVLHRIFRKPNVINMDGIEWKRQKWGKIAKAWFWLNERFGCWFGSHLVADHPEIKKHLATRVSESKITMIPYGAPKIESADRNVLVEFGLLEDEFAVLIARAEPENSILEVVKGFSEHERGKKLVVLGNYDAENNLYHEKVLASASNEVCFLGAIYDQEKVAALRRFARFYIHGHQVGGTNPSLVEALGAGSAILAHDNKFNCWVAGEGAKYFKDSADVSRLVSLMFQDDQLIEKLRAESTNVFLENFQWPNVLEQYERLLSKWLPRAGI